MGRRVAITGIGVVSPLATERDSFWTRALAGEGVASPIPAFWQDYANYRSKLWAPLPEIDFSAYGIGRPEKIQTDLSGLLGLASAFQAIEDAGLTLEDYDSRKHIQRISEIDNQRAGVFCGTGVGGIRSLLSGHSHQINARNKDLIANSPDSEIGQQLLERMKIPKRFNPFSVLMSMPNAVSATIGIKFSLHGLNNTYTAACAAGTMAIGNAMRAIRNGYVDLAITGGSENLGDEYGGVFKAFDVSRALVQNCDDAETANRPFDKARSGFLFAEGAAAMLVLEEFESAKSRGARIYAELAGYEETFDAHSMMMIDGSGTQIERAMRGAVADAALSPTDIDYVNAHGTGTISNDEIESAVIERVFGSSVLINSTKGLIGHSMGASGAIEAAVTAMSLYHQTTPPNRNLQDPIRDLNFVTTAAPQTINAAISESFAFGGHNAVLAFKAIE